MQIFSPPKGINIASYSQKMTSLDHPPPPSPQLKEKERKKEREKERKKERKNFLQDDQYLHYELAWQ